PLKERQNMPALQLTADEHLSRRIDAVNLKHRLGDVETDCRDRLHAWLPITATAPAAITSMALTRRCGSRPQHQMQTCVDVAPIRASFPHYIRLVRDVVGDRGGSDRAKAALLAGSDVPSRRSTSHRLPRSQPRRTGFHLLWPCGRRPSKRSRSAVIASAMNSANRLTRATPRTSA